MLSIGRPEASFFPDSSYDGKKIRPLRDTLFVIDSSIQINIAAVKLN